MHLFSRPKTCFLGGFLVRSSTCLAKQKVEFPHRELHPIFCILANLSLMETADM